MTHTPGPWFVRDDREFYTNHPQPFCIATEPQGSDEDTTWIARCMDSWDKEMAANARLIAAAPELLDWLKKAEQMAEQQFRGDSDIPLTRAWSWLSENCQKVIAKAEGK